MVSQPVVALSPVNHTELYQGYEGEPGEWSVS